jgi:hypothetical protein
MKRFIVTHTPGSGKTAIIRQLELEGFSVVEEAAATRRVTAADQSDSRQFVRETSGKRGATGSRACCVGVIRNFSP